MFNYFYKIYCLSLPSVVPVKKTFLNHLNLCCPLIDHYIHYKTNTFLRFQYISFYCFKRIIKRTLTEMGCPPHILDDLMENCHERRWPAGLCSLETRQNNRRQYENYVCKRVPGKQAVLVLSCDNGHMGEDMMVEPGLVMIFAHGIE